jgi:alkylhydroperoxidase/carboxymuconolactone decarboxylase family protein YurZ
MNTNEPRELLQLLAAHDEGCVQSLVSAQPPERAEDSGEPPSGLDRRTRILVVLAGLLAADAGTASLRWAAERAAATGINDETLVSVLLSAGSAAGSAWIVAGAARLAQALDAEALRS